MIFIRQSQWCTAGLSTRGLQQRDWHDVSIAYVNVCVSILRCLCMSCMTLYFLCRWQWARIISQNFPPRITTSCTTSRSWYTIGRWLDKRNSKQAGLDAQLCLLLFQPYHRKGLSLFVKHRGSSSEQATSISTSNAINIYNHFAIFWDCVAWTFDTWS
jgi:hypothetical protein